MKKIIFFLLIQTLTITLFAQSTWSSIVAEPSAADGITKLIKTSDGGFAVLLQIGKPLNLYKYNSQGELLWEKTHDFGSTANNVSPYCISDEYVATRDDIFQIFKILKKLKLVIGEILEEQSGTQASKE